MLGLKNSGRMAKLVDGLFVPIYSWLARGLRRAAHVSQIGR
jgi:hypothetical protein